MNKIKRISWFFRVVFQFLLIIIPIISIAGWMFAPSSLDMHRGGLGVSLIPLSYTSMGSHGNAILHSLSLLEKFLGFSVGAIPMAIELFILYSLIKLFKLYERGEIFLLDNVCYLRNIGYALLLGQMLNPLYEFAMGMVLTFRNPPGHRFASITIDQTNVGMILIAFLVILISWIMVEGCKLREEQQLTV